MEDARLQWCHVLPPAGRPWLCPCNVSSKHAFMCHKWIITLYLGSICVKAQPICWLTTLTVSLSSTCWTDHESTQVTQHTHNSRETPLWYDAREVHVTSAIVFTVHETKGINEAFNITCNMFCFSLLSGVKPGHREQVVASLPGTMAPATQRVSSLFPPTVCGRTAQNCSVQPQSAAPR